MKDQTMPCGHKWSDYVSCDTDNGTYMCGKCSPIGMRVAQLQAENVALLAVIKCGATMGVTADHYLEKWLDNFEAIGVE